MPLASPVKFFHSGMPGAPSLLPAWGSLTSLLDAVLINGFGLTSVASITVTGGIATASVPGGHVLQVDQVALIGGAVQTVMNDEFRVTARTATSFQFAAPAGAPATVTGTLTARVSPLNWEIAFTGSNKRAYRSKNVLSPKNMLLINDGLKTPGYTTTWAKWANVGIVSAMSDIDTITGIQAPFNPAKPTLNWANVDANQWGWFKWYFARVFGSDKAGDGGGAARNWVIIGDDRLFYLFNTIAEGFTNYGRQPLVFGDIISFRPADVTGTILSADASTSSDNTLNYPGNTQDWGFPTNESGLSTINGKVMLRGHTQVGAPVSWITASMLTSQSGFYTSSAGQLPFPNAPDNSLFLLPTYCRQQDGNVRGLMPGLNWIPQQQPYPDLTIIDNVEAAPGKKFALISSQYSSANNGLQTAFDIVGPWR